MQKKVFLLLVFMSCSALLGPLNISFASESQIDLPIGQTSVADTDMEDIWGRNTKIIHPYLSLATQYTDNFYNTPSDEKSEYGAILSPGFWLAFPCVSQPLLNLTTHLTTQVNMPGGLSYSRRIIKSNRRVQGYLSYRADLEQYLRRPSENTENHAIEGLLQWNLRSGLSLELLDKYLRNHDARSTALTTQLDRYETNFANVVFDYDISPKFKLRFDYHQFLVDYTSSRNDALDRLDSAVSGYVFTRVAPKSSVFMQYQNVDINHDTDQLSDSTEHRCYLGLDWDMTARTWGRIKSGFGKKNMDDSSADDVSTFLFETRLSHELSAKTTLMVEGEIGTREATVDITESIMTKGLSLTLQEDFTRKLSGNLSCQYQRNDYDGEITEGGKTGERYDDLFTASIATTFNATRWLTTSLSYTYSERRSNFSIYNYVSNSVVLSFQMFL